MSGDKTQAIDILHHNINHTGMLLNDRAEYTHASHTGLDIAYIYNLDGESLSLSALNFAQKAFEARILEIQHDALARYIDHIKSSNGEAITVVEHILKSTTLKSSAPKLPHLRGGEDFQSTMDYYICIADALIISPAFYDLRLNMIQQGVSISLEELYEIIINTVGEELDFTDTSMQRTPTFYKTIEAATKLEPRKQLVLLENLTEAFTSVRETVVSLTPPSQSVTQTLDIITNIVNRIFNRLQRYRFELLNQ